MRCVHIKMAQPCGGSRHVSPSPHLPWRAGARGRTFPGRVRLHHAVGAGAPGFTAKSPARGSPRWPRVPAPRTGPRRPWTPVATWVLCWWGRSTEWRNKRSWQNGRLTSAEPEPEQSENTTTNQGIKPKKHARFLAPACSDNPPSIPPMCGGEVATPAAARPHAANPSACGGEVRRSRPGG